MKNRALPKETLAKNLRYLMTLEGLSEAAVAKRAKVSQKAVNKVLNQTSAATIETVDKLASAFGLNMWHLIMPDLPEALINSPSIEKLYGDFCAASPKGREYIVHVAEREAAYLARKDEDKQINHS